MQKAERKTALKEEENVKRKNEELEEEEHKDEKIEKQGAGILRENDEDLRIYLMTIIGEIEGHELVGNNTKATKYEHIIPKLAEIEDDKNMDGVLVLINTMGGDVEAGLAIAEMIASLSKPTVTLVLGGSHSIGVPIAVSSDYSFIVPTGTMVIHPVRTSGMVIGVSQTFDYFKQIQNRIVSFVCGHCKVKKERFEELMLETGVLTKDVGSVLVGSQAVEEGIIDEVGGIREALKKIYEMAGKVGDR